MRLSPKHLVPQPLIACSIDLVLFATVVTPPRLIFTISDTKEVLCCIEKVRYTRLYFETLNDKSEADKSDMIHSR